MKVLRKCLGTVMNMEAISIFTSQGKSYTEDPSLSPSLFLCLIKCKAVKCNV